MNLLLFLLFLADVPTTSNPTVIIISGPLTVAASTEKKILVVRIGATDVHHYDVAVGTRSHPTPTGRFTIRHLVGIRRGSRPMPVGQKGNSRQRRARRTIRCGR